MATKLPRQVQAQLDAAEAALAAQTNPPAPPAPVPPEPTPAPAPAPIVDEPPPQPPAPAPATPPNEWEHKYRVLQGMFNQRDAQLKEAMRKIDEIAARQNQAPAPTAAPTAPPKPTVDPKDVEAFGLDMVSMVQRTTEQVLAAAGQAIEARIKQVEDSVSLLRSMVEGTSQTVAQTAEEIFFEKLTTLAPKWKQLNTDQGFLAWLSEPDPIYGAPRDAALKDAQERGDATRAAAVFNTYVATLPPAPAAPPAGSPTPKSAGSSPPVAPTQKPTYTQAQVAAFYADVARGRYRGREKDLADTEAAINAAMAEGRIV